MRANLMLIGIGAFSRTTGTDAKGQGTFLQLTEDDFRLVIRLANGKEIEDRVSTRNGDCFQFETVRIDDSGDSASDGEIFVSDLKAPERARKFYEEGILSLQREQWPDAQQAFENAIEIYPRFAGAYNGLGVAASETKQFDIANQAFSKALQMRENYSEAYLNFAKSLIRQKNFSEAESPLKALLGFDQENRVASLLLVQCLYAQHKFDEVIDVVHNADLKHLSHNPAIHGYVAEIYQGRGMAGEFRSEDTRMTAELSQER